jgi:hypothetical protein
VIRNKPNQVAGAQVIHALSGVGFDGPVICYVTGDGGTQTQGEVNGGIATHEGKGYYTYRPSADETNFATVAFTFEGVGGVTASTTYDTFTPAQERMLAGVTTAGLGAMTCRDLLTAALRRIGVVAQGITPQAETLQQALIAFNSYVDSLAANRMLLYGETRTTWALEPGKMTYLVGPGQDIDRARPVYLEQFGSVSPLRYIDTNNEFLETPLTLLTEAQWRAVSMKGMTGTLPGSAYYDPTYPFGTLHLWQTPTSASLMGVMYAPTAMGEYNYDDVVSLPPGYRRFLITNLAMELCAEFEREPPSTLPALAQQAKADVERANIVLRDMATDPVWSQGGAGVYNIYSDTATR